MEDGLVCPVSSVIGLVDFIIDVLESRLKINSPEVFLIYQLLWHYSPKTYRFSMKATDLPYLIN